MLTNLDHKISIVAFYLSKFDMDAVRALGYENFSRAFEGISLRFGKNNNYLKLRRDEFDALTDSPRKGWNKRPPAPSVYTMFNELNNFKFDEMTNIVNTLLADADEKTNTVLATKEEKRVISELSEEEIEQFINRKDMSAGIKERLGLRNTRIFDNTI